MKLDPDGGADTFTVTLREVEPPAPEQASVNVADLVSEPEEAVPLVARVPLQSPDAVQLDAFVAPHVSVEDPPLATDVGSALNVSVGAGVLLPTLTVAERVTSTLLIQHESE